MDNIKKILKVWRTRGLIGVIQKIKYILIERKIPIFLSKMRLRKHYISRKAKIDEKSLLKIGENVQIKDYVIIQVHQEPITIGRNTVINPFTVIYGYSPINIGNNVMIAPHVMISSGNHDYKQVKDPMLKAGILTKGPIIIEDDVWIGSHAVITDGIKIGRGAVIGAGSVVTKDVKPWNIVGGIPARIIGHRR